MKQENKIVGLYPLTKFYLAIVLVVLDIIMPGILSKLVVFVIGNIISSNLIYAVYYLKQSVK